MKKTREDLSKHIGHRKIYTGVFQRYGFIRRDDGQVDSTIVLKEIRLRGKTVADHAWFVMTDDFRELGPMSKGDKIMFRAKAKPYEKEYGGKPILDIGLSNPTGIRRCQL